MAPWLREHITLAEDLSLTAPMFDSLQPSVTSVLRGSDAFLQPPWTPTYTYTEVK